MTDIIEGMKHEPWKPTYFVYRDANKVLLADLASNNQMLEPYKLLTKQLRAMMTQANSHYMDNVHEQSQEQGKEL